MSLKKFLTASLNAVSDSEDASSGAGLSQQKRDRIRQVWARKKPVTNDGPQPWFMFLGPLRGSTSLLHPMV
jgi:hypothetical protein